ncbi:MAG: hypothetical protein ACPGWR_07095 [Ardenticatenaceae bacterium]
MQYPLREKIGDPSLLVGREREWKNFGKWLRYIPKSLGKSRVILARRKSGKTAFVQRIFNQLWSENGAVIPFYFDIAEKKIWYPDFAINYYRAFASQYISFLERDESLVRSPLSLEEIRAYGTSSVKLLVRDVDSLLNDQQKGSHDLMWITAYTAPHRFADVFDQRILVILDEFQNLAGYVYRDEKCEGKPDESMPGSFHSVVESKVAPMLVTGSYVGLLMKISSQYLQGGRLSQWRMTPYLTAQEGLQAVYKYSQVYDEPITNDTAPIINRLCMSDPFFISSVILSNYSEKDLTTETGVINTVNYEIISRHSQMSKTWAEYIESTLDRVNDIHGKNILLHLSKNSDRYWTHRELKSELQLELPLNEIKRRLVLLAESDVIERGVSDIDFRGLQDGTLNLILRNRFEKEIKQFVPDLRVDFQKQIDELKKDKSHLRGKLSQLTGKFAEYQLLTEFRSKKRFSLSAYFDGVVDERSLNIIDVRERFIFQRDDGKRIEIDLHAKSSDGRVVLVEVKKTQEPMGSRAIEEFQEKIEAYQHFFPDVTVLPAFLSLGGFTAPAAELCKKHGIATAERIKW